MPPALRHPGCACRHTPAPGHGQPLAEFTPRLRALGFHRAVQADRPWGRGPRRVWFPGHRPAAM